MIPSIIVTIYGTFCNFPYVWGDNESQPIWNDQDETHKVRTMCIVWFYDRSRKSSWDPSHKMGSITFHKGMPPKRSPLCELWKTNDEPVQPVRP